MREASAPPLLAGTHKKHYPTHADMGTVRLRLQETIRKFMYQPRHLRKGYATTYLSQTIQPARSLFLPMDFVNMFVVTFMVLNSSCYL